MKSVTLGGPLAELQARLVQAEAKAGALQAAVSDLSVARCVKACPLLVHSSQSKYHAV